MQEYHVEYSSEIYSLESGLLSGFTRPKQVAKFNHYGGSDPKIFLNLTLDSKGEPQKYIARFDRGYTENWLYHKAFGLPVVEGILYSRSDNFGTLVYTPDLTVDGSALYGKARHSSAYGLIEKENEIPPSPLDVLFVAIMSLDFFRKAILGQVYKYADLATKQGYYLAYDDPFELSLHPDKTWELICLDLEQARFYPKHEEKMEMSNDQRKHFEMGPALANMLVCSDFWSRLQKTKAKLVQDLS